MKVQAILKKKHNDKTGKSEWALVSKKSGRVLRWFGAQHPSEERVKKEERRIQYFKHHGSYPAIARVLAGYYDKNKFADAFQKYFESIPVPKFRAMNMDDFADETGEIENDEDAEHHYHSVVEKRFDANMFDLRDNGEIINGKLLVKRLIKVDDPEEFLFHLANGTPLEEDYTGVGIYWSWSDEGIGTYDEWKNPGAEHTVLVEALVDLNAIDIPGTVWANAKAVFGEAEKEITLKPGAKIEIIRVDEEPVPKPIRFTARVVAADKSYDKMDPAKFKYSNAQGFITADGNYYQIRETHSDAMQESSSMFDRPDVVSVGHDGGNNVTFPVSVWENPKAKQHRTLRILLGALDAHGFGWDDMEVGLGDYWYHATKVINIDPHKYMKHGPPLGRATAMDIAPEPEPTLNRPKPDPKQRFRDDDDDDGSDDDGGNKKPKPPIDLEKHPKKHILRMLMDERKAALKANDRFLVHEVWKQLRKIIPDEDQLIELVKRYTGPIHAAAEFQIPTKAEIVEVLRKHPLIRLKEKVKRAFLVGSFAAGKNHDESDVDILLEVEPHPDQTAAQLAEAYRRPLQQYFVTHNIRGKDDSVHPQWAGRRVDLYFTYDADQEDDRPKIQLNE